MDDELAGDSISREKSIVRRRERLVLLVLAAVQFTSIIDFMVVMPLGDQLMRSLNISAGQHGLIVTSYVVSAGLAGLLAATLVDRFGRRAAYLTLFSGFLVGTLFCGLVDSYEWLIVARVVTGAFGGILGGLAMAIIGDVFPDERRGAATGALMSGFALASVVGLPFGLYLGTVYRWHAPFFMLAALGVPVLIAGAYAMPPLREHLAHPSTRVDPLADLWVTFTHPNHLRAFSLIMVLMLGAFCFIPYLPTYLIRNVGVPTDRLPLIYIAGGGLTLVAAPLIGKWADRRGKLAVYRIIVPISAVVVLWVTNLPRVSLAVAVASSALLMVGNAGRMVVAMAMITASVEPRRRGSFMSVNSSVQHLATGLATFVGSLIIATAPDGSLRRFDLLGGLGVVATLFSLYLAGRLRVADPSAKSAAELCLGAAAEGLVDASEPIAAAETA